MYSLKPVLSRFENIDLPTNMYRLRTQEVGGPASDEFLDKLSKQVEMIVKKVNLLCVLMSILCIKGKCTGCLDFQVIRNFISI